MTNRRDIERKLILDLDELHFLMGDLTEFPEDVFNKLLEINSGTFLCYWS